MEARIRERFTSEVRAAVLGRFGSRPETAIAMGGFESFVFEIDRGRGREILRVAHSLRRAPELIRGELAWIEHLAERGLPVARPLPSPAGSVLERIDDGVGGEFLATAFAWAPGHRATWADWTPPTWERLGVLLGRLHGATEGYVPSDRAWARPGWDSPEILDPEILDPEILDTERLLPADAERERRELAEVVAHLQSLPRTDFGLIHRDVHAGNFHVDEEGALTLFDFDDCCRSWFADDLAIALFYACTWEGTEDREELAGAVWTSLRAGYERERALPDGWRAALPWFLRLRELGLLGVIHRSYGDDPSADPWAARFLSERAARHRSGRLYLDLDAAGL